MSKEQLIAKWQELYEYHRKLSAIYIKEAAMFSHHGLMAQAYANCINDLKELKVI
jgi:hypothetical protein